MIKGTINDRKDIILLIDTFYNKVKADDVIGFIFNDIAKVDWPVHLPVMYDFWEHILLEGTAYGRNPMNPHFRLNERVPLQPTHFNRWLQLFEETVQELFEGEKATLAITRARSIKGIMEFKMNSINARK